jgi:hypothetical protein
MDARAPRAVVLIPYLGETCSHAQMTAIRRLVELRLSVKAKAE